MNEERELWEQSLRWVPLPEFGSYVAVDAGVLYDSPMMQDGSRDTEFCEVTAPEDQRYLDAVNRLFGTTFTLDQFAGR